MNDLTVYHAVKDQMKTGDLLQWRSNGIIGDLICWKTGYETSHSSLVLRLAEYEGLERRRFTTEALGGGPVLNLLSNRLERLDGTCWWYPLKDEWDPKRQVIGENALRYIGRGVHYDYKSIFAQIFESVSADAASLFCSEYCFISWGFTGPVPYPGALIELGITKEGVQLI
jgi:hypothetical protein